mgnify:FL=1
MKKVLKGANLEAGSSTYILMKSYKLELQHDPSFSKRFYFLQELRDGWGIVMVSSEGLSFPRLIYFANLKKGEFYSVYLGSKEWEKYKEEARKKTSI